MRDRNHLNLQQFNIQLTKTILRCNQYNSWLHREEEYFSHNSCLWRSDPETPNSEFRVYLPRDFRLLRSLSIVLWKFPKEFQILYRLELEKQTFSWLNRKQQLELSILLNSESNCLKYLYLTDRYTSNEIFGNFLGNDLKELLKYLKIKFVRQTRARKKIFRRGPKDKGSRRSDSSIRVIEFEIQRDVWVKLENELYEKRRKLLLQTKHKILNYLENFKLE